MKKRISVVMAVLVALVMSLTLTACGGKAGVYKITFDANGGSFGTEQTVLETVDGKLAAFPQNPTHESKIFAGYNFNASRNR